MALTFESLTEYEQIKMRGLYIFIEELLQFEARANPALFAHIFPEGMDRHYWEKFCAAGHNIMTLMRDMTPENRGLLIVNVSKDRELYAHCYDPLPAFMKRLPPEDTEQATMRKM